MKIAVLLPKFSRYGGVEQFGYRLSEALAAKGYQVDFICARQEVEPPVGVSVIPVGRIGGTRFTKLLWFLFRSEVMRKRGKYDLTVSLGKNLGQDLIRMGGGPLRIYWQKSECALAPGLRRFLKRVIRAISPVNWLILCVEKRQFTASSRVVAVSHLVRQWLLEAYPGLNPELVTVVYNKPDLTRFAPVADEVEKNIAKSLLWKKYTDSSQKDVSQGTQGQGVVALGTASTNFVLKGVAPLVRSLTLLPKHYHLFVAGGRNASGYQRLAGQLGVANRVHFCGRVDDMPAFYRGLDLFILPTFYDACSNAVLEALASGCRTVSSLYNGASYFLSPDQVLSDPGDSIELAEKIEQQMRLPSPGAFIWPQEIHCGVEAFVEEVVALLATSSPGKS